MQIVKSKNQVTDILLYPCLVQGEHAASEIAAAIDDVNKKFPEVETIIAGRGGGSMEDLWAFNEEIVAVTVPAPIAPAIAEDIKIKGEASISPIFFLQYSLPNLL